jgi:hypothetical protein
MPIIEPRKLAAEASSIAAKRGALLTTSSSFLAGIDVRILLIGTSTPISVILGKCERVWLKGKFEQGRSIESSLKPIQMLDAS